LTTWRPARSCSGECSTTQRLRCACMCASDSSSSSSLHAWTLLHGLVAGNWAARHLCWAWLRCPLVLSFDLLLPHCLCTCCRWCGTQRCWRHTAMKRAAWVGAADARDVCRVLPSRFAFIAGWQTARS
jgi:hypothetical protein